MEVRERHDSGSYHINREVSIGLLSSPFDRITVLSRVEGEDTNDVVLNGESAGFSLSQPDDSVGALGSHAGKPRKKTNNRGLKEFGYGRPGVAMLEGLVPAGNGLPTSGLNGLSAPVSAVIWYVDTFPPPFAT